MPTTLNIVSMIVSSRNLYNLNLISIQLYVWEPTKYYHYKHFIILLVRVNDEPQINDCMQKNTGLKMIQDVSRDVFPEQTTISLSQCQLILHSRTSMSSLYLCEEHYNYQQIIGDAFFCRLLVLMATMTSAGPTYFWKPKNCCEDQK